MSENQDPISPARDTVDSVRIAFMADWHAPGPGPGPNTAYREHLEQAIRQVNEARVDLALVAGDLADSGKAAELEEARRQAAQIAAPVLWVPGNHDVGDKVMPGRGRGVTEESLALYESIAGPSYYATVLHGLHLVAINTSLLGSGLQRDRDQWAFLEKELDHPGLLPTLLLMHYPAFLESPDEPGDYWNVEPEPRERLLRLIRQGGVKVVFSGHIHWPLHVEHEGVLYQGAPPVSFGLPPGQQPEGWLLLNVHPGGAVETEFHPLV